MTTTFIGAATGTLQTAGDSDWYAITLTAGTEYLFNIGNGTLSDPQVTLYNSAGTAITSASGGGNGGPGGENSQLAYVPTSSGTYYVGASSASGTNSGSFAIQTYSAPFDFAPNINTNGTLAIGGSVAGNISNGGQNDWFKVQLTAGTEYVFNIASGTLTNSGTQLVTLYSSTGQYIVAGTDYYSVTGNQITYIPTTTGNFFVGVSALDGATGSFSLSAATATFDFGDTPATAGSVTVGGAAVSGNLTTVQQRDWFGVSLTAGTAYSFTVSGGTLGANATVALYNSAGSNVVPQISGGASNGAERVFVPTTSGTYYVEAGGALGTTGSFSVAVATLTDPYISTVNTAGTLSAGNSVSSSITAPGESNWFKVSLNAGSGYIFKLSDTTLTGAVATLYDANGNQLTQASATGSNPAQLVYEPTSAGTFYISAGASLANTGSYTLTETSFAPQIFGNTNSGAILSLGTTTNGTIANSGQSEWFKVSLTAGKDYVFDVGGALAGEQVTVYNGAGVAIAGGVGTETSLQPSSSGTYFVGISSNSGSTGAFTVTGNLYSGQYAATIGTTGVFTSAAGEVAAYKGVTLTTANSISDSLANVAANLDGLQSVAAAGLLKGITLTDSVASTPVITLTASQFANDHSVLSLITSPYTLQITGYSSAAVSFIQNTQNQGVRYLPGTNHSGSDQVIEVASVTAGAGTQALGTAYNAVIIDGAHSSTAAASGNPDSFSFNVDANGTVTLLDNNTGASEAVTGANYLIFNDAAANPDGSFQSIYFVQGSTNAQITDLYEAAFLRQPDLAGLEFYAKLLAANTYSVHQVAAFLLASPEFLNDYPTASTSPDNGGAHDQAFVNTLYQNILGRTPAAAELAFYAGDLANGSLDRAQLLIDFSISPENQAKLTSFLINTSNGAFADANAPLPATTVLNEVATGGALNSAAVDPNSINVSVTANGITLTDPTSSVVNGVTTTTPGSITLSSAAPSETVYLSSNFANLTLNNNNNTVFDTTVNSTITVNGANNFLSLGHGGVDTVNLLGGTNTTIVGFTPGSGTGLNVANTLTSSNVQILDGSTTQVSNLTFNNGTNYVVNVGNVGAGTAALVAAAANTAYAVADSAGENLTFMGQTSSGGTVFYFFGSTAGVTNGIIPASSLVNSGDTAGNHSVTASELTFIASVLGVAPNQFSSSDLA